jgi:hypothetical protein
VHDDGQLAVAAGQREHRGVRVVQKAPDGVGLARGNGTRAVRVQLSGFDDLDDGHITTSAVTCDDALGHC